MGIEEEGDGLRGDEVAQEAEGVERDFGRAERVEREEGEADVGWRVGLGEEEVEDPRD